ncbi:Transcriptional adapter ada2 [Arthrobotrys musiformis]|uniref:Transcriptional adapter 2 n=1 Tax=Arthrobotrys musiformis TaxID=47236 RepID=A0AAV9WK48_9PEZI
MTVIKKKSNATARATESGVRFHCDVCSADISSTVRIRCADASCPEFDLCVSCFSEGKTCGNHRPASHSYCVIEQHSIPIFDEDWGADEELLLLEGAETYGLGSWADVADHIGGGREKDEVRDHYYKTYIESSKFPLPELSDPAAAGGLENIPREEFQARKKRRIEARKAAAASALPLAPKKKPTASVPACHEVQGYMPGRMEFEVEYENEAETTVKDMFFDPGDGINPVTGQIEPEIDLKLTVMDIYNHRLTQRVERKKVIFEHALLEYKKNQAIEKRRSKEEKELLNKAKPFARIMNHTDYTSFADDLQKELSLRQAILTLQEWRRCGIRNLEKGAKYELEKAHRTNIMKQPGTQNDRVGHRVNAKTAVSLDGPVLSSPHLLHPGTLRNLNISTSNPTSAPISSSSLSMSSDDTGDSKANGVNTSRKPNAASVVLSQPAPFTPTALNNENAPDFHLLTEEEKRLCNIIGMHPKPYLVAKDLLMKEAMRQGGVLKKKQAKEICKIDVAKVSKIHDFFVACGWIGKN